MFGACFVRLYIYILLLLTSAPAACWNWIKMLWLKSLFSMIFVFHFIYGRILDLCSVLGLGVYTLQTDEWTWKRVNNKKETQISICIDVPTVCHPILYISGVRVHIIEKRLVFFFRFIVKNKTFLCSIFCGSSKQ